MSDQARLVYAVIAAPVVVTAAVAAAWTFALRGASWTRRLR